MNVILITCRVENDEHHEATAKLINELGPTWHDRSFYESIWWVRTELNTSEVRNHVVQAIPPDSHLWVCLVTAWNSRYSRPLGDWLRESEALQEAEGSGEQTR